MSKVDDHQNGSARSPVNLRVYDISAGAARIWSPIVLGRKIEGVWHSGVEVFGYEYFYGGGIVKMQPENVESTFGISPSRIHHLGHTTLNRSQFEKYLIAIMPMFTREVYDLVNWNCNHFSDHTTKHLLEKSIPSYILDLPHEIYDTFMGKLVINFFKMMQGGAAPIGIDDPAHPSRVLLSGGRRSERPNRRNSCPPSPSSHANVYNFGMRSKPSVISPRSYVRSSRRRQTHTPTTTSTANRLPHPSQLGSARSVGGKGGGGSSSPGMCNKRPSVSFVENQGDEKNMERQVVRKIQGFSLLDQTERTHLMFSPSHKVIYERERDKYANTAVNSRGGNLGRSTLQTCSTRLLAAVDTGKRPVSLGPGKGRSHQRCPVGESTQRPLTTDLIPARVPESFY